MGSDPPDDPHATAVDQLEQLGLSTYAARTFVTLVGLEAGTAKDVSRVSEVPRTRVYDAAEELHDLGLVDIKQSSPREFSAVSVDTTCRKFEREARDRITTLSTALDDIEPTRRREKQRGVWTVEGQAAVTDRVLEFVESADSELVYMTVEDLLTDELVDALHEAAERGVSIKLAGVSPPVQEQIRHDIPGAEMFESLWLWSDTPAGRLVMVDGEKALVSVRDGEYESSGHTREETAIWGAGEHNSLVVVLKAIFTWRLDAADQG